ncbi:YopX family protein [Enterococcus casseliflavus]|uniref:YopX family protein n=1 Tax=Enterococcus casseliflavus TaxID=37734 RepID=UPI00288D6F46|nr:YopX family protein [Enterococcus casseliflavus]MDT2986566.1 YopX family protein [Enterococcus casseliflavus]
MVPKFRAWDGQDMVMRDVEQLRFAHNSNNHVVYITIDAEEWATGPALVLMQSTGLKDKNGVEIFEGDIIVNQYGNVGYVAYLQQEAGFVVVLKKSDYRLGHRNTGESYDVTTNHEVIGNIHSNPELLDKSNE